MWKTKGWGIELQKQSRQEAVGQFWKDKQTIQSKKIQNQSRKIKWLNMVNNAQGVWSMEHT
jgi:hypothetical protein